MLRSILLINQGPFLLRSCQKYIINSTTCTKEALSISKWGSSMLMLYIKSLNRRQFRTNYKVFIGIFAFIRSKHFQFTQQSFMFQVRPPPEGLCQPSTPPRWRCQEDAQPASPWTRPGNPAHCCCGHWGGRWFPSPQHPALRGGTSHLENGRILTSGK